MGQKDYEIELDGDMYRLERHWCSCSMDCYESVVYVNGERMGEVNNAARDFILGLLERVNGEICSE